MTARPRIAYLFLGILVIISAILMRGSSLGESAIMDEKAHIPAGYGYARYLDYRLNPEHPPLLKVLAGISLIPLNPRFPTADKSWTSDVNGQWNAGDAFLYFSGNNADDILQQARLGAIFLTLLTIILIYIWGAELLGRWWALLPAGLFALSPTVLEHGHFVTTDIAATFGLLLSTYLFLRWMLAPSKGKLAAAGIGFGIAQLSKFSLVLLVPFFFILLAVFLFAKWRRRKYNPEAITDGIRISKKAWRLIAGLILIFAIGYALVYVAYAILVTNYPAAKQIADTENILAMYNPKIIATIVIAFAKNSILRPFGDYLLGFFMVLQRSAGGNTGYFFGDVSNFGWWYYFPVVFLIKEPLPSLLLLFSALFAGIGMIRKNGTTEKLPFGKRFLDYLGTHFHEFGMWVFIIIYWVYSMRSPLNIGVRHVLPTIPLIYILLTTGLKQWWNAPSVQKTGRIIKTVFLSALLVWYAAEAFLAYPYFLSYFNEIGGGTWNGYRYVTDSNYDWGQDMKRLQEFVKANRISKIAVDYFGGGNPAYYLGSDVAESWSSALGNPKEKGIEWLAVSVGTLESALGTLHGTVVRNPEDEYTWLTELRPSAKGIGQVPPPDYRAGTSIFIYKL
ncbi:MAG: glycosyltransferase family 39 protein [Patescibacteria group bacterium]